MNTKKAVREERLEISDRWILDKDVRNGAEERFVEEKGGKCENL